MMPRPGHSAESIQAWILNRLTDYAGVDSRTFDPSLPFERYGLASRDLVALTGDIEEGLGIRVSPVALYEYPTLERLAAHLAGESSATTPDIERESHAASADDPIAIVGMACRFPGAADLDAFWINLCDRRDSIGPVPPDRWDQDALEREHSGTFELRTRWGGFLEEVDMFDASFFGISPREATRVDPQQRLLLEVTWDAVSDAGLVAKDLAGSATGVFVGVCGSDYGQAQLSDVAHIDGYVGTGSALSITANRLSYFFDWRGPSLAVDTACSSSLVAVHLACQSLSAGETTLAVAAGANLILSPALAINFSQSGAMAADGRCKAFDARADGYVRAEGIGAVVLKRLARARADGDRVYAVIAGSAVNQDGRTNGLMAPNPASQEAVLRTAYSRAHIAPGEVAYVEAHGSGTLLGDPIEAKALGAILGDGRPLERACRIGSVKTNVGHLEAAAGIAGLIKVALSLHHRQIPPSLHFTTPNPYIPFDGLRLRVQTALEPWPAGDQMVAGVSSFGFGGVNAHAVLTAASASQAVESVRPVTATKLLPLSARSPDGLRAAAAKWARWLERLDEHEPAAAGFEEICSTAAHRRSHLEHRLALQENTCAGAARALDAFVSGAAPGAIVTGTARQPVPPVVFVCPGQGGQWPGMGVHLWRDEPVFRESVQETAEAFRDYLDWDLGKMIRSDELPDRIDVLQPVLFAMSRGLAQVWKSFGVEPDAVVGHSLGEVAAACIAGALSLEDAAAVICRRSALLREISGIGAMAVVELSPDVTRERIGAITTLSIAAINGPTNVVVAGEANAVHALVETLAREEIFCREIRVDVAAHSPQVDPLRGRLRDALSSIRPTTARIPIYSTVTGTVLRGPEMGAGYWARHLREPVLFGRAVVSLLNDQHFTFIELGPHPVLLHAVTEAGELGGQKVSTIASLRRDVDWWNTVLSGVAQLFVSGYEIAWDRVQPRPSAPVSLPGYAWQRRRFWIEQPATHLRRRPDHPGARSSPPASPPNGSLRPQLPTAGVAQSLPEPHPLLGPQTISSVDPDIVSWSCELDPSTPLLNDHRIGGEAVLPATAYVELMLAAARSRAGVDATSMVKLEIEEATVMTADGPQRLQVAVTGATDWLAVRVSAPAPDGGWSIRAQCEIEPRIGADSAVVDVDAIRARCGTRQSSDEHYAAMARRSIHYGPLYRGVGEIWRRDGESIGSIVAPTSAPWWPSPYVVHPALLDACLQVAVAAMPQDDEDATMLPVGVDRLRVIGDPSAIRFSHAIVGEDPDSGALSARITALDGGGRVVAEILGLRMRRLDGGARRTPPDDRLFEVTFQELAHLASTRGAPGRWLITGGHAGLHADLAGRVRAAGGEPIEESALDGGSPALSGVVWLRGLALDDPGRAADCADIIPLVRSLEEVRGADGPVPFVLVTRGAQPVPDALRDGRGRARPDARLTVDSDLPRAINPVQAVMLGLGRVIAQEHAELVVKLVDLDPETHDARGLFDELFATDDEDEIALRYGRRFAPRLSRFTSGARPDRLLRAGARSYALAREKRGGCVFREITRRPPGSGEVELAVRFASLDGRSCIGEVSAATAASGVVPGQRVIAVGNELVARHAIVDARLVWPVPRGLDEMNAAVQPAVFLVAAAGLGRIKQGERVHVLGDGAIAGGMRDLVHRAEGDLRVDGDADVLIETRPGLARKTDVASLKAGGRWITIDGANTRPDRSRTPAGPNRARIHVDVRALIGESPAYARELLDPILAALEGGDLSPVPCRRLSSLDLHDGVVEDGDPSAISVELSGADVRIARKPGRRRERDKRGTWLITGGWGGIGRVIAAHLVEGLGARGIVLVGRSAADRRLEGRTEFVSRLERAGATVRTEAVDVADADAVTKLFERVAADRELPRLSGIIHAAGVLEDGVLVRQDRGRFERVFAPKVMGAWNLHQSTVNLDLDYFILFSSLSALIGNPGQANYAAANAFLDALAWARARVGLPALAIAWGAWSDVGLVARRQERVARMEALGTVGMTPAEGASLFANLLDTDAVALAALRFDAQRWRESHLGRTRMLETLLGGTGPTGVERIDRATVLRLAGAERLEALVRFVRIQVGEVVRLSGEEVAADQPLGEIGLDSLMAVEVRGRLQRALGVTVPLVRILGGASPLELARFMDDEIGRIGGPSAQRRAPDDRAAATAGTIHPAEHSGSAGVGPAPLADPAPVADIDRMDDDEVHALLERILEEGFHAS